MTLTSVLPSLRASVPDPLDPDVWPAHTSPTLDDVVTAGVSLRTLVDLCGTPCVHTATAARPGSGGSRSSAYDVAVVVARVHVVGSGAVRLDVGADTVPGVWREARLFGRISTAPVTPFAVGAQTVVLPRDVRAGDLIAIPCSRTLARRDVRQAVRP